MNPIVGIALAAAAVAAVLLAGPQAAAGPAERNLSIGGLAASYLRPEAPPACRSP